MKHMRTVLLIAVLGLIVTSACTLTNMFTTTSGSESGEGPAIMAEEVQLSGTVVGQRNDCIFDGICSLFVEIESGEQVEVIYVPGMMRCEGTYDGNAQVGDTVEIYAQSTEPGIFSICTAPGYYIRIQ